MCRRKRPPGKPNLFFYGANMLPILNDKNVLTMSSREIAGLVNTSHDSVLKTVRDYISRGVVSGNETPYRHEQNKQTYFEFKLCKRDALVVASGYSVELRARIIDRWQELEEKPPVDPMSFLNDPAAMRSALLSYTEKVLELQPKADAFDAISNAEGELCLTDAAKYLHVPPRKFNQFLQAQGWIFKRNGSGSWTAYQRRIDQGFLTHKRVTYERNSGETEVVWQPLVTPEGVKALSLYPAIQEMQSK